MGSNHLKHFLSTGAEFEAQAESLISVLKFQTENNMRDIIRQSRIGMLASGVQSSLDYQSFFFNGSWLINRYSPAPNSLDTCACSISFDCPSPRGQFFCVEGNNCTPGTVVWGVPGLFKGCISLDNIYFSDLRCFYNQSCLDTVLAMYNVDMPDRQPLPEATLAIAPFNSLTVSRFAPTDSLSKILDQLMIEEWTIQFDFTRYYEACAPLSCTYTSVQRLNFIGVFTSLVGLTGGLSVVLRILVSTSARLLKFLIFYRSRRQHHTPQLQVTTDSGMKILDSC